MPVGKAIPNEPVKSLAFVAGLAVLVSALILLLSRLRRPSPSPQRYLAYQPTLSSNEKSTTIENTLRVAVAPAHIWLFAACAFMVYSAYNFRPGAQSVVPGAASFIIGAVLLWLARPKPIKTEIIAHPEPDRPVYWMPMIAGGLALFFLTRINAVPNLLRTSVTVHLQFGLLIAGIILLAWGLTGGGVPWMRVERREALFVLAVTLLALGIRIWALGDQVSIPVSDEYTFAQKAIHLQEDNRYPLLHPFDAGYAFPWLYPYFIAGSLSAFGSSVASLRLPSAIFGTLTIPALYLLAKHLFDRRIALLAAMLLATFPPHIHLSRLALNNIADPFFGVLALGLIARGIHSKRRSDFALGGLALGMTQYFYEGGRLLFPLLVLLWLMTNVFRKRRFEPRQLAAGIVAAFALALPIYLTLSAIGYSPTPRLDMVAPDAAHFDQIAATTVARNILPESYLERMAGVLLFFVHTLDNSPEFYGGPQPMILTPVVPVFLLGLCYTIFNWRQPGVRLLLIWLIGMVLGLSLIRIGAWTARYVPVFPAIALLIALAIYYPLASFAAERYRMKVALGLVILIGIGQVAYYFGPHLELYNRQARYWRDYADAYQRAIHYPPNTDVIFITDDIVWTYYIDILKDLWKTDLPVFHYPYERLTYEAVRALPPDRNYVFFVNREDYTTPALLRLEFKLEGPYFSPYNVPDDKEYALYFAPAEPSLEFERLSSKRS